MRADRRQRAMFACGLCLLALLVALLIPAIDGARNSGSSRTVTAAEPLIINPPSSHASAPSPASSSEVQAVARSFVRSYLPVLYGRRPATSIVDADRHVRESLATARKPVAAPRRARPRVSRLEVKPQAEGGVLVIATISDRVRAPYRIAFLVARSEGALRVTELANY